MPIYSVTQVSKYIGDLISTDVNLSDLYITGEVSNLSRSGAGHAYFSLKDGDCQLRGVMFRNAGLGTEHLQDGASVTAHGRIGLYSARGDVQLIADQVQPEGVGELHMEFTRLKAKLDSEGLFDPSRKRPIPSMPRIVAVVTSFSGSVRHDIQTVIERRFPLVELIVVHTPVQGDQAVTGILEALKVVNNRPDVDVAILARGGGSLEELWAFNEEAVARSIHASRVPIISAIGHETDFTIADLVADHRAPTPSAAAEICVPDRRDLVLRLSESKGSLRDKLRQLMSSHREATQRLALQIQRHSPGITNHRQRVDELARAASALMARDMALYTERLRSRQRQIDSLNPVNTLDRGYALVEREADKTLVSQSSEVSSGDQLSVHMVDGSFQVIATKNDPFMGPKQRKRPVNKPSAEQQALWKDS